MLCMAAQFVAMLYCCSEGFQQVLALDAEACSVQDITAMKQTQILEECCHSVL